MFKTASLLRGTLRANRVSCFSRSFHSSKPASAKLNVEGLAQKVDLKGENVLVRVDLNVPLAKVSEHSIQIYVWSSASNNDSTG